MNLYSKEAIQEQQYQFPYHHLTHEKNGGVFIFKHLFWGLEHYTYITFVIQKIFELQPTSLADIGCGEGRIISDLEARSLTCNMAGYDISERAITFAKAFTNNSAFAVHDILRTPLKNKVDFIVSCEVIEHIEPEKVQLFVDNIHESLEAGGKILITTPTTNVPTIRKHYQHFTSEIFDKLLQNKFKDVQYSYLNQVNWLSKLLNKLIANRFFLSNSNTLNSLVLKTYRRYHLLSTKEKGSRIMVIATKI